MSSIGHPDGTVSRRPTDEVDAVEGGLSRYLQWVVRRRVWVIALVVVVTAVLGTFAARQQVIINPATVVPQGHPYIQATNTIERIFGSKYLVVIGVTPTQGDALQPRVLETVQDITRALYASPSVSKQTLLSLSSRQAKGIAATAEGFEVSPLMPTVPRDEPGRQALRDALQANPVYRDSVISSDWKTATVLVELKEDAGGFGAMLRDVDAIVEAARGPGIEISVGGNPVFLHQAEVFADRINWLFPIAVLVIGLLHFEAFRTVQGLVLPLVTAVLSVVWGVGIMGAMGVPMDIFNSPTPILILAVAAGHAVQLLKRYYECYAVRAGEQGMVPELANRQAIVDALLAVGPVLVIAGGVAALGFFSLVVFQLETVRAFGIFTGIGILSAVVLEFTFTPAVRASLRPPRLQHIEPGGGTRIWDRIAGGIAVAVERPATRRRLIWAVALLVALAMVGWPRVQVDNASKTFFDETLPVQRDDALLNARTGGTNALYVMIDSGAVDGIKSPQVLAALRTLQAAADAYPEVGKTVSIDDFLSRMHVAVTGDGDASALVDPRNGALIAQYLFLYAMSGDPGDFSAHVDYEYRRAKLSVMLRTHSNAEIAALVDHLRDVAGAVIPDGTSVSFGGEVAQTLAVTDVMVRSKLLNIIQILAVIFLVSAMAFRSFLAGALVLSPLLVVLSLVFGVMGHFGVPLNIPNSLISAMAVGIGADYAIYLIHRTREYALQGIALEDAINRAIRTAGKACLFVATAVAGGYAVLFLSHDYNVHMWLATFIVLAMVASVLTALVLIPAALLVLRPAFLVRDRSGDRGAVLLVIAAAIGFLAYSQLAWAGDDARAIMERNADVMRFATAKSQARFELVSASGGQRRREADLRSRLRPGGRDTERLIRFESPADIRGTATLLVEDSVNGDGMWVYLPALKRVRRLAASNRKDSFVGTDFSYGDVMGHRVEDWTHVLEGERSRDGMPHWVVASVPATQAVRDDSGYGKRITWIRQDNHAATRVDVFDTGGQPYKRFEFKDLREVAPGKWQPMEARGENLQSGHRTTITFTGFEAGVPLADDLFSPNRLDRP
ncbi:outer membrane lipoprotein-sorting protein [Lysobacter sp. SG-8]|uniref:Outer membrane lipoprotein-sorting protein n=1 Tax=Marilutibacter penaei TaxID=2759900 RepID=A0A7W3YDM3_9GAMM|nr:outer membrane lipoprotein-sorting protein [Lysobacter penaei]MBB1087929.1 outer membrane lipoprotein-sorting protein [Lysobacter penaei]